MINVRSIQKLKENDGLTLKKGNKICYKSGYQVATEGQTATNPADAMKLIKSYKGNCGIWLENGIYYIDKSFRIGSKKEAMKIGKENKQISILKWADMSLIYC